MLSLGWYSQTNQSVGRGVVPECCTVGDSIKSIKGIKQEGTKAHPRGGAYIKANKVPDGGGNAEASSRIGKL